MQKLNLCEEVLKNAIGVHKNCEKCGLEMQPLDAVAVQAMEELLQYREIGTVEECRADVEKIRKIEEVVKEWDKVGYAYSNNHMCEIKMIVKGGGSYAGSI